jgi:hypothetical protein
MISLEALVMLATMGAAASAQEAGPAFWQFAPTPPMGWNSYDAYGDSVTEKEFLANAGYVKDKLLSHGWQYVVVDYRWYDAGAHSSNLKDRAGAPLTADEYGRLLPAPNRFPSAADGRGFKSLADKVHAMGLKFGIHVQRGIPRQDVKANTPIEGSNFKAADAANTGNTCPWNPDMFGVNGASPAGQAWYDSLMRLYAQWGVDLVKVDDLSNPYSAAEIEAVRKAIDKCGRPIVFSTSPGETPISEGRHIETNANLWRTSGDFWDNWRALKHAFTLAQRWEPYRGPGHWPDLDMIPLGRISIRCHDGGPDRRTRFTADEQTTLMTLWAIARSPLMLGANLPDNDPATLALFTNDEVLAVNQRSRNNRQLYSRGDQVAWVADVPDSTDKYVALFRTDSNNAPIAAADPQRPKANDFVLAFKDLGITGPCRVRDLWKHKDLGSFPDQFTAAIASHGAGLYRVSRDQ